MASAQLTTMHTASGRPATNAGPNGQDALSPASSSHVFCGITTADVAPWLTVATVDQNDRLLDIRHISDDPVGYAYLSTVLADRGSPAVPVALDGPDHVLALLWSAAQRPIALADAASTGRFAERFADDTGYGQIRAPRDEREAVGLARALRTGLLLATVMPHWRGGGNRRGVDEIKPALAAHDAVIAARQASAAALRKVLEQYYPAALEAYPNPAEMLALQMLDAFPDADTVLGLGHGRPDLLVGQLIAAGFTEPAVESALTVLRYAVSNHPTPQAPNGVATEAVRQAVAAVQHCDAASSALVATMTHRLSLADQVSVTPVTPAVVQPQPTYVEMPYPPRDPPAADPQVELLLSGMAAGHAGHALEPAPESAGDRAGDRANDRASERQALVPYGSLESERDLAAVYAGLRATPEPPGLPVLGGAELARSAGDGDSDPTTLFSIDPLNAPLPWSTQGMAVDDGQPAIFSQTKSAWFIGEDELGMLAAEPLTWGELADDGWRAAERSNRPSVGEPTMAGLPRRIAQANLIPGSPHPRHQPRVHRDPDSLALHAAGYFRGWQRGLRVATGEPDEAGAEAAGTTSNGGRRRRQERAHSSVDQYQAMDIHILVDQHRARLAS